MKKFLLLPLLAVALIFIPVNTATATVEHCPDHNVNPPNIKFQNPAGNLVLPEGALICVKASTGNTGVIEADGETTLRNYLKAALIVGGDGEGRDPSYVVIYPPLEVIPVSAFICFEGDIEVLTAPDQFTLNLLVSLFLELNVGAVQVESEEAECEEPIVTTTTTAPPVLVEVPVEKIVEKIVEVPGPVQVVEKLVQVPAPAPAPAPAPVTQPAAAPANQLPRTGSGALALLFGGLSLIGTGSGLRILSKMRHSGV